MTNVTLRGGIAAGRFRDRGKVPSIQACVEICCISKTCDVAFLLKNNCFSVTCLNERQCEAVKARSSVYRPQLVYIYARTKSQFIVAPADKTFDTITLLSVGELVYQGPADEALKYFEDGITWLVNRHDNCLTTSTKPNKDTNNKIITWSR